MNNDSKTKTIQCNDGTVEFLWPGKQTTYKTFYCQDGQWIGQVPPPVGTQRVTAHCYVNGVKVNQAEIKGNHFHCVSEKSPNPEGSESVAITLFGTLVRLIRSNTVTPGTSVFVHFYLPWENHSELSREPEEIMKVATKYRFKRCSKRIENNSISQPRLSFLTTFENYQLALLEMEQLSTHIVLKIDVAQDNSKLPYHKKIRTDCVCKLPLSCNPLPTFNIQHGCLCLYD